MRSNCYCFFLLLFFLVSCKKTNSDNKTILEAEKLMEHSPLAGIKLLETISNPSSLSASDYAAWCLNYTYGFYKIDSVLPNDKLFLVAIHYYDKTPMHLNCGKAYYLLGYFLESTDQRELAMNAFKQAELEFLIENDINYLGLVNQRIGTLYLINENYEKAILSFRIAHEFFYKASNYKNEAYALRDIARAMDELGADTDSVMYYNKLAQSFALKAHDIANFHDINYSMSTTMLCKTGEYELAKQYLLNAYRFDDYSPYYYAKLSLAYAKLNVTDSALFFFNRAVADTSSINEKMETYAAGAYTEKARANYEKAFNYYTLYVKYRNQLYTETKKHKLYIIDRNFNLVKKENENAQLKIYNRNMIISISVLVVIILLVFVVMLILQNNRRKDNLEHELELQKLSSDIENKRLLLLSKIHNRLNISLQFQKLKAKYPNLKLNQFGFIDEMIKQNVLNENEWQTYLEEANIIFNNFFEKMSLKYPSITLSDKIVIAMIALRVDITDACFILDMSKNTMYRRRNTIKERLGLEKVNDLDMWIQHMINKKLMDVNQFELIKMLSFSPAQLPSGR